MSKRIFPQTPDFSAIVTDTAAPMAVTAEPVAPLRVVSNDPAPSASPVRAKAPAPPKTVKQPPMVQAGEAATANLENLNFKVPRSFRKRFRDCAYRADLKHNELLFAALDAWEAAHKG